MVFGFTCRTTAVLALSRMCAVIIRRPHTESVSSGRDRLVLSVGASITFVVIVAILNTGGGITAHSCIAVVVCRYRIKRSVTVGFRAVAVTTACTAGRPRRILVRFVSEDSSALTTLLPVVGGVLMPNNFGVRMTNDIFVINIEPEIERSASNKVLNDMPVRVLLIASSLRLNLVHTGHDCHAVACSQTGIFIYRSIDTGSETEAFPVECFSAEY